MSQPNTKKIHNAKIKCQYQSMRVSSKTKVKIDTLLEKINANTIGKKVKADQLIEAAMEKIGADDIRAMQDSVTSNLAYFDKAFDRQKSKNGNISKDDFFALVLSGKIKIPELEKRLSL